MKKTIYTILFLFLGSMLWSCSDDDSSNPGIDNVQEFIFLTDTVFSANESGNSTDETAIEIHAEMYAFSPRREDVVISLEILESNATAGTDYEIVSSSNQIVIPAGSLTSEVGFRIKTIDNSLQAFEDRSVSVVITSVSDEGLNVGLGIEEVTNDRARISIADDECPDTIDKFDGATWSFAGSNTVYYSDYAGTYSTAVSGTTLMISGDIANYDVGITMEAIMEPDGPGATSGTLTFESSTQGNDGTYDYRWILKSGTYDVCANTMEITTTLQYIDIYGPDPTAWVDWYDSNISATVESFGSGGGSSCEPGSIDGAMTDVASSFTAFNSEYYYADYDNSYTDLTINVNDDCSILTVSGDFLDLGGLLSDIQIEFIITPDAGDSNIGTLALATQVLGTDGSGFEYRVRTTGTNGSYNLTDGSIEVELFVDYDNNGAGYVNWYTATSTFTIVQ